MSVSGVMTLYCIELGAKSSCVFYCVKGSLAYAPIKAYMCPHLNIGAPMIIYIKKNIVSH